MGYACPVCGTPQRDGEHLANHLAFTAMLGDDGHGEWLDEHAPGWSDDGPGTLADRVTGHAPAADYEEVFEDTVHDRGGRGRTPFEGARDPPAAAGAGGGDLDPEAREILREARTMTEEMLDADGDADAGDADGKEP